MILAINLKLINIKSFVTHDLTVITMLPKSFTTPNITSQYYKVNGHLGHTITITLQSSDMTENNLVSGSFSTHGSWGGGDTLLFRELSQGEILITRTSALFRPYSYKLTSDQTLLMYLFSAHTNDKAMEADMYHSSAYTNDKAMEADTDHTEWHKFAKHCVDTMHQLELGGESACAADDMPQ